ncbi:tRNA uridine-5-carboxymethylaminomethyl(34) synthesis GTPase MnmE [Rhizobium sp. TH2]|uniref:tRNA uridine-5-carboxymethylaminomethyl(34) synthesis GTPase MnmE n=1 Tax=Rhizobium sp. TH2 TaxID=2775403 RepID=UPI0021587907|nr:tRNA uridine-5-carboxymethylaminomethyl(34) synthesis GTPase MnmE [Rhizobium sp. TH2]UVC08461.1 tRNA uridine-5-carboxymethylaminomethyl(34) synthesis GTPase MnmE [Rhizobium sp. TH2]
MPLSRDTIYALSSGALPSGVAVVRVSGSRCADVLGMLCGPAIEPRHATLRWIRRRNGEPIDKGLVLYFPAPNSFTGEDCIEFQLHGGRAVVDALLDELSGFEGLRHAEPGEFSRRAFDNGKLDLVEIEGLADLISAETEMQRRLALEQSSGALSKLYTGWADRLTRIRALIEAELDFPDEDDVPGAMSDRLWPELDAIARDMRAHLSSKRAAEIIRDGFRIVIAGRPNAGKSSLLNALAKRDVAIVTSIAGTTRDIIGVDLNIDGFLVHVMDTAGLRETDDEVEREGVRRALKSMEEADLVLVLKDCMDPADFPGVSEGSAVLYVLTKSDLLEDRSVDDSRLRLSTKTGEGFDSLTKRISNEISTRTTNGLSLAPVRARQISNLHETIEKIEETVFSKDLPLELRAELLRRASRSLGKITGTVDVEDLLGVIFSEFCIGK